MIIAEKRGISSRRNLGRFESLIALINKISSSLLIFGDLTYYWGLEIIEDCFLFFPLYCNDKAASLATTSRFREPAITRTDLTARIPKS